MSTQLDKCLGFFKNLYDLINPIKNTEVRDRWIESRKGYTIGLLLYVLITRFARLIYYTWMSRISIEQIRKNNPEIGESYPETLNEEGLDVEAERFYKEGLVIILTNLLPAVLYVILIPLTYFKSKITYFVLPLVLLIDKWFEYPVYSNYIPNKFAARIIYYSHSSLF